MTPKNKAIELENIFFSIPNIDTIELSKRCALEAVDFMIKELNSYSDLESSLYQYEYGSTTVVNEIIYYENVKKELELL